MKNLILTLAGVLALTPTLARAEVFVWQDPAYKMQVTFPDNWMRQGSFQPNLRLHVVAPQGADHAACRLFVNEDGRYRETPPAMGLNVSASVYNQAAFAQEFYNRNDTSNVYVSSYGITNAIGPAGAVMAQLDFNKSWMGTNVPMHAIAIAAQYDGKRIFMTCESMNRHFAKWEGLFRGIFQSVNFPGAYSIYPNGQYRRFQDDGGVILPMNPRNDAVSVY